MKKKLTIGLCIFIIIVGVVALIIHLSKIHKYREEFYKLNSKYGNGYNTDFPYPIKLRDGSFGAAYFLPAKTNDKYSYMLKLLQTPNDTLKMTVTVVGNTQKSFPDSNGHPEITMVIKNINNIIEYGISRNDENILCREADKNNWQWNPNYGISKEIILHQGLDYERIFKKMQRNPGPFRINKIKKQQPNSRTTKNNP